MNKKYELMLTRCTKAYNSSCLECALQSKIAKIDKNPKKFKSSGSFKVIYVDTTEKLVISAAQNRQKINKNPLF